MLLNMYICHDIGSSNKYITMLTRHPVSVPLNLIFTIYNLNYTA